MKISDITYFLDGGTIQLSTDKGELYIDGRLNTDTKGKIFLKYPKANNSNLLPDQDKLKKEIVSAIQEYTPGFNFLNINFKEKVNELLLI